MAVSNHLRRLCGGGSVGSVVMTPETLDLWLSWFWGSWNWLKIMGVFVVFWFGLFAWRLWK